jgi:hypothetical protein
MASLVYTQLYSRINEKQPIFDFMIKKADFYINTHGVSVTELGKSYTSYNDGLFYILNKNNKPIYFNGLYFNSIRMRRENGYPSANLTSVLSETRVVGNYTYEDYILSFRRQTIGKLTIGRLNEYVNESNVILNPFQSLEMSASYTVLNLNRLDIHYFGKSNLNPNKTKGTIDISFNIKCFANREYTQAINDTLVLTINTINTGYVPQSLAPSTSGTSGFGY